MSLTQLTDIGFETADITVRAAKPAKGDKPAVPEQKITVRGIGLQDIRKLLRVHGPGMAKLFDDSMKAVTIAAATQGEKPAPEVDPLDAGNIMIAALEQAPDLIADLIVLATDSPNTVEAFKVAERLPLPVQLKALTEIVRLTLEEHGGLGEFIETVLTLFGGVNGLVKNLRTSEAGSLQSNAQSAS